MAVRILLVLAAFAILYDCDQANAPAERREQWEGVEKAVEDEQPQREQANLPDLDVMMNEDCSAGFPQKCINVATDATSGEAFTLLTEHFRDENSEYRTGDTDELYGGPGGKVSGSSRNGDTLYGNDGDSLDTINGGGYDVCIGDPGDYFVKCEYIDDGTT